MVVLLSRLFQNSSLSEDVSRFLTEWVFWCVDVCVWVLRTMLTFASWTEAHHLPSLWDRWLSWADRHSRKWTICPDLPWEGCYVCNRLRCCVTYYVMNWWRCACEVSAGMCSHWRRSTTANRLTCPSWPTLLSPSNVIGLFHLLFYFMKISILHLRNDQHAHVIQTLLWYCFWSHQHTKYTTHER